MDTVISPVTIPYVGNIPGGAKQGMEIEIQGTVPHYGSGSFSVNVCQYGQMEPNTLMHFNVRPGENCVVINSMQNNGWGGEERKHGHHGFHKGKPFDLRIMVKPQMFKIKANGQHIADFPHRLPKEFGQFLVIKGEVSVNFIKIHSGGGGHGHGHHHGGCFEPGYPAGFAPGGGMGCQPGFGGGYAPPPSAYPMGGHMPPQPAPGGSPIYNPPVPFKTGIPGGLSPGRMINISGVPHANPSRFSINLQNGFNEGCDVMFHCDIRFRYGDGSVNTVVRNHCQRGGWGQEERQLGYFPFMPNANFDIILLIEPQGYKVAVNNQHMLEFRHRLPYQEANTLNITGDVRLTQVRFQ